MAPRILNKIGDFEYVINSLSISIFASPNLLELNNSKINFIFSLGGSF